MDRQIYLNELNEFATNSRIQLSSEQIDQIISYSKFLTMYNEKINLVADADPRVLLKKHILDSLTLMPLICEPDWKRLVDLGSGAGFPGLILAIAHRNLEIVLVESIGKKAKFLQEAASLLGLSERVCILAGRAETIAYGQGRESFDLATSRALGHLGMVCELAFPLLQIGGVLLCLKSREQAEREIKEMARCRGDFGAGEPQIITPVYQCGAHEHVIVHIDKVAKTSGQLPRSWSKITNQWKQKKAALEPDRPV